MSEKICALEGCGEGFVPTVHNQRFHAKECCRIYTNKRILEQYHTKKNRDMKNRRCAQKGCTTVLSVYNEDRWCGCHQREKFIKKLRGWGWSIGNEVDFA